MESNEHGHGDAAVPTVPSSKPYDDGTGETGASSGKEAVMDQTIDQGTERRERNSKETGRGKEKEQVGSGSFMDRLQASTRMAVNTVTTGKIIPDMAPTAKTTGVFNNLDRPPELGEPSQRAASAPWPTEPLGKSIRTAPDSHEPTDAFDQFVSDPGPPLQQSSHLHSGDRSVAEQEASDGTAVLQLLSRPGEDYELEDQGHQLDGVELSPVATEKLRRALFESTDTAAIAWNDLLNFAPEFLVCSDDRADTAREVELHMGTSDVSAAQIHWLQQWGDVLSAYTDQVWGDLGPLAAMAKKEVDQLTDESRGGQGDNETKALGRLRQILAHVRGH